MNEIICNVEGLLFHYKYPHIPIQWQSPFRLNRKGESDYQISKSLKKTLLLQTEKLGHGPKICRAICLLLRMKKINSAKFLLEQFLRKETIGPRANCLVATVLCEEKKILRKAFCPKRNRKNFWDLRDLPAWIIPSFIFSFRKKIGKDSITIISGNSAFGPEKLLWFVEEKSTTPYRIETLIFEEISNFQFLH